MTQNPQNQEPQMGPAKMGNVRSGYESVACVLEQALQQAQGGKGAERHSTGQCFESQPILEIQRLFGSGFAFGQVVKKMEEAQRLPYQQARAELLGAIIYAASAVIRLDELQAD